METPRVHFVARDGDALLLRVDADLYGPEPVLRTLHAFSARCYVHAERQDEGTLLCRFQSKRPGDDLGTIAGEFANELLDQSLRFRLRGETEAVRRLVVAQAFSRANLVKPELDAADPRDDPLGVARPDPDPRRSEAARTSNVPTET